MADNSTDQPKKRRGPGRPFQKGQSGNPGGLPAGLGEVSALARAHTTEAVERLVEWMRSDNSKASPAACIALLNRGWGLPKQTLEAEGAIVGLLVIPNKEPDA